MPGREGAVRPPRPPAAASAGAAPGGQRLLLEQLARQRLELGPPLLQDLERVVVGPLDPVAHREVDLARRVLAEAPRRRPAPRPAEEGAAARVVVGDLAERLVHAVAGDHAAGDVGDAGQVVGGAGRELAEDELLRRAAAQQHGHLVLELLAVIRKRSSVGRWMV